MMAWTVRKRLPVPPFAWEFQLIDVSTSIYSSPYPAQSSFSAAYSPSQVVYLLISFEISWKCGKLWLKKGEK
jgi:hypothetical protein